MDPSLLAHGDIFFHVGVSTLLAISMMIFTKGARREQALVLTVMVVMSIGIGKEVYDGVYGADLGDAFSIKDLVSDYAGMVLGILCMS